MRSEGGDWRRQDATEVWYFAEKSSHCLKVDGVTPRRKITSGAASINSLLPHAHSRNHPYPRSEGNSSSIILVPTLPPTSLRLSFFLTRLSALPPSGSSVPLSSPQNLPRTQPLSSPFHLSRNPDERVYGITRNKTEFICISKKYIYIHTHIHRHKCHRNCHNHYLQRSHHFVDDTFRRIHAVPNIPYSSQPKICPTNRGSANPINQNILKPRLAFRSQRCLPFFSSTSPF